MIPFFLYGFPFFLYDFPYSSTLNSLICYIIISKKLIPKKLTDYEKISEVLKWFLIIYEIKKKP